MDFKKIAFVAAISLASVAAASRVDSVRSFVLNT